MKLKTFAVPYITDERMLYAGEYLCSIGYERTDEIDNADFVLLPIPVKKHMFDGTENKAVFYGAGDYYGFDYNKVESFLTENAYMTAEGAVALMKESIDISVYNADILLVGYGRIAQSLHRMLESMGANVTVCSRSNLSKSRAKFCGAECIDFEKLKCDSSYDVIFNTVPHIVFTKKELDALDEKTKIIDLASFPGGVDTLYAKSKGIELIDGKRLPSRYSPKSAGFLIGKTVDQIIKGDLA